jgi:HD-GYP domain-containing protein (c-di-GMP phosphodiesterase class II)
MPSGRVNADTKRTRRKNAGAPHDVYHTVTLRTAQPHRGRGCDSTVKTTLVSIDELASTHGIVEEDVLSPQGALLLPRGTPVEAIRTVFPDFSGTLSQFGIRYIRVSVEREFLAVQDLQDALSDVHTQMAHIDPRLSNLVLGRLRDAYRKLSSGIAASRDISLLLETGCVLAREIAKTPSVMFSLERVRAWDEYSYVHSLNVALLSGFLASVLFRGDIRAIELLSIGGLLHDLGKALIPREILNKPGQLDKEEYDIVKRHPIDGERLAGAGSVRDERILCIVRTHHERWNGTGYPAKIKGEEIPIFGRIAAVADVFDALTSRRVYKEAYTNDKALGTILCETRHKFDRRIVRALLGSLSLYPPSTVVELSDGSVGVVLASSAGNLVQPDVLITHDVGGRKPKGITVLRLSRGSNLFVRRCLEISHKSIA